MLHCNYYNLYEKEFKPIYKSIETSIVTSVLSQGRDLIIDRGVNITRRSRRRFIGLASAFDTDVYAIVFPFESSEVHVERRMLNGHRDRTYYEWMEATERHIKEYEVPLMEEGFKDIKFFKD